jgi:DNA primase
MILQQRTSIILSMPSLETTIRDTLHRGAVTIMSEMGTEMVAYCPFHGNMNTPSFSINRYTGLWQCFNPDCNMRGGIRMLKKLLLNEDYRDLEAASKDYIDKLLSEEEEEEDFGEIEEQLNNCKVSYNTDTSVLNILLDRGFSMETLEYFEIGFSVPKSRVVIPARDQFFNLVGLIGRAVTKEQIPRYLYSTGFPKRNILFNLNNAKIYDEVIIVEGSLDAMKIHQAGYPNVVATLGAIITDNQMKLIKNYFDSITIIPDNDDAGRAMKDAIIQGVRSKETYLAECPEGFKDAADLNSKQISNIIENRKNSIFN